MAKKRIFVDREGNAMVLLDDKIEAIQDFGERTISRASVVEFHNDWKSWIVCIPEHPAQTQDEWPVVAFAGSRKEALEKEVVFLEILYREQLKNGEVFIPSHSRRPLRMEAIQHA